MGKSPPDAIVQSIYSRYGKENKWCYFGATLNQLGACEASYSRVRAEIEGDRIRFFLSKPASVKVNGVHPPDFRRAPKDFLIFEGTSGDNEIVGTFFYYVPNCEPIKYRGNGNYVVNNGILLGGEIPRVKNCRVVGSYSSTLHFFKNMSDITPY